MPLYEHVFIARQDVSGAQVDSITEQLTEVLKEKGGSVANKENWGLRNLAYRIKKNRKGHYVMLNIDGPAEAILELERQERIHDDVLRYLTIRVGAFDEGPSVMLQGKSGRGRREDDGDDRGRGGDRDKEKPKSESRPRRKGTAQSDAEDSDAAGEGKSQEAAEGDEQKKKDEKGE